MNRQKALFVILSMGTLALFFWIAPPRQNLKGEGRENRGTVPDPPLPSLATRWVVNPEQARQLIDGGATLLDARGSTWLTGKTLEGAIPVRWQEFSRTGDFDRGHLLGDDNVLARKLRDIGVSNDRPVVVFADPVHGWGEDGRIVWMLRTLGHQQAVLVDGGYLALMKAGVTGRRNDRLGQGDWNVRRTANWEIDRQELRAILNTPGWIVVDVREDREFRGETPYGEQRPGRIPGVRHLYYRDLLARNGTLLPRQAIVAKLQARGIFAETRIVAYCTAGVRAAWFTSVLQDAGFTVKNYAGSMLEWSASPAHLYPMTVSH